MALLDQTSAAGRADGEGGLDGPLAPAQGFERDVPEHRLRLAFDDKGSVSDAHLHAFAEKRVEKLAALRGVTFGAAHAAPPAL